MNSEASRFKQRATLAASFCLIFWVGLAGPTGAFAADPPANAPTPAATPDSPPMFGDLIIIDSIPNIERGGFKIAENESPVPQDRVFFNYNYFSNVESGSIQTNFQRETIGFEKTFLDGNASFGLRLPFNSLGAVGDNETKFGDLSLIGKYAFINNSSGNVLSAGLVITAPTGSSTFGIDIPGSQTGSSTNSETIHSVIVQPFISGKWQSGSLFVQGFSSIAVPTDSRDVTYWFNDVGVGYWIYQNPAAPVVQGVVPMVELHINTPFERDNTIGTPIRLVTTTNFTGGVQFDFAHGIQLAPAISVPLTGPKPYDIEAVARLNFRF